MAEIKKELVANEEQPKYIYLLVFDDGFEVRIEKASFDGKKIEDMANEYNGEGTLGPYECQKIEME